MSLKARRCVLARKASHPLLYYGDSVLNFGFEGSANLLGLGLENFKLFSLDNNQDKEELIVTSYDTNTKNGNITTALVSTWNADTDTRCLNMLFSHSYPFLFQTDFSLYHFYPKYGSYVYGVF